MISKKDISAFVGTHQILLQTNEFICLCPHPNLGAYISNYNITFPTTGLMPDGFTIMPCGCSTLTIEQDNKKIFAYLEGPTTKPSIVGNQTNQLEMFVTIEFKPAGLYALTGISQNELVDQTIPLNAVHPKLTKLLLEAVEKAENAHELATYLDMLLQESMYVAYHPQLMQTLRSIVGCAGNVAVKRLSDEIHYSERQLNRIFKQHVGVSAKSFSRLIRTNNAFHLLNKPTSSITLISDIMGFHDLSHFVRDFRLVCGMTPQEYRNNMSDFYINTMKF